MSKQVRSPGSRALFGERYLPYRPTVAREIGVIPSLLLEKLDFWLERATKKHDGKPYVYKTYTEWGDELGFSSKVARGGLDSLRTAELVEAIDNPFNPYDRTLWWTINPEKLAELADKLQTDDVPLEADDMPHRADRRSAPEGRSNHETPTQKAVTVNTPSILNRYENTRGILRSDLIPEPLSSSSHGSVVVETAKTARRYALSDKDRQKWDDLELEFQL